MVLAVAGLHTSSHYVEVCRACIMRCVMDKPVLELYRSAERRRGTTLRRYWWEQPTDLAEMSAGVPAIVVEEGDTGEGGRSP